MQKGPIPLRNAPSSVKFEGVTTAERLTTWHRHGKIDAIDALDGARSAASKCYRLVASKPERIKEVRPGNDDGV
jgi:hypothetical protein